MVDSGSNNYSNGLGCGDAMERDKKVRIQGLNFSSSDTKEDCEMNGNCNGGGSGGSEGEDGYGFRSPLNTNGVSSRKKFKLQRKVSDERYTVDPASVPRRLRSAINKHISQSSSPPMLVSKRRQLHASNGTQNFNYSAKKLKQKMLDVVTKEEEEVAETLTSMATLISISESFNLKENGRMLEEDLETKATSTPLVGDSKEEGTKILHPCNGSTPTNPSPHVVELHETTNVDPKLDAKSSSEPNSLKIPSKMKPEEDITPSRQAMNLFNPLGGSLQCISRNRLLQPQLDAISTQKHEMGLGLWPLGSSSRDQHDLQSIRQKPERDTHGISRKEIASDVQPGFSIGVNEHLAMPSSSKSVTCPNRNSTNGLCNEMLSLNSADKKRTWNRCTTHVYLTHLIRNHQKPEKNKQQIVLPVNQSKAEEMNYKVMISSETGGSHNGTVPLSNGLLFDRNMLDARTQNLQDERLLQAQRAKQGFGILSFAGLSDTKSSGNGLKSSGQVHVTYPPPHESVMPFGFSRGPYTSHYQEQFAAAPNQQVQLQPSPYLGINSSLYGPHIGHPAGSTAAKQQQQLQMWQAHLAHYRPQLGFPPKWQQNGQQHHLNPSSPSPAFPYNPHNNGNSHFILPMPSSSSSLPSRSKQQQMQMVCNADSFR